jgi:hypothetical protein
MTETDTGLVNWRGIHPYYFKSRGEIMSHLTALSIFLTLLIFTFPVMAFDIYSEAQRKQTAKEAQRWSLSQWLEQKQRMQLMDTWLMFNPPSPYEFFVSIDTSSPRQINTDTNGSLQESTHRNYRGALGAYVSMFGLYAEYEDSNEELKQWKALFSIRVLGSSDQSTHMSLHYGLMNQNWAGDPTQHQVGGARFNLYLAQPFAITGLYEKIWEATSEQGVRSEGYRLEAGAHLEYGALRIYGSWFEEQMELLLPSNNGQTRQRRGILFGTRLYF